MKKTIRFSLVGCTIASFGVVSGIDPAMPEERSSASRDTFRIAQYPPDKRDTGEPALTEEEKARRKKQQEERAKAKAAQEEQKRRDTGEPALTEEERARRKKQQEERAKAKGAQEELKQREERAKGKAAEEEQKQREERAKAKAAQEELKQREERAKGKAADEELKQREERAKAKAAQEELKQREERAKGKAAEEGPKQREERAKAKAAEDEKQRQDAAKAKAVQDEKQRQDTAKDKAVLDPKQREERAKEAQEQQKLREERAKAEQELEKLKAERAQAAQELQKQREERLKARQQQDKQREERARAAEEQLQRREQQLKQREEALLKQRERLDDRRQALEKREHRVDERVERVEDAERRLKRLEDVQKQRRERVETTVGGGKRVVIEEPDKRLIIKDQGRVIIRHDESALFRKTVRDARTERRPDGTVLTFFRRPDGGEVVSVVDADGRLIRRYRRTREGREIVLIDNRRHFQPGGGGAHFNIFVDLRPPVVRIPRHKYIVEYRDASDEDAYEALSAPPIEPLDRSYSLEEVRGSHALRERMRRVDLDAINFEFGSWEVTSDQYSTLERMARIINRILERNPDEVFLIEGHTDAVGSEEDNLSLSDRRAEAVALILSDRFGVPPENLTTQGYGEQFLKVDVPGPERANRRVAVRRITPLMGSQVGSR